MTQEVGLEAMGPNPRPGPAGPILILGVRLQYAFGGVPHPRVEPPLGLARAAALGPSRRVSEHIC